MKRLKISGPFLSDNRRGFTLLELMVVIVIIGILAGFTGIEVMGRIKKAKITGTQAQIKALHQAVKLYYMDTDQYPYALEDLVVQPPDVDNWSKNGYLDGVMEIPLDKWNYEYLYDPGEGGDDYAFYIYSYGADGEPGGDGENADLYNVEIYGESGGGDDF